ncbi:MAG: hypothetical protein V8S24_00145 [Gordonibacter pamelaeae]
MTEPGNACGMSSAACWTTSGGSARASSTPHGFYDGYHELYRIGFDSNSRIGGSSLG